MLLLQCAGPRKHALSKHAISLTVPEGWKYKQLSGNSFKVEHECGEAFCKNMVVQVQPRKPGETVDQIGRAVTNSIPTSYKQYSVDHITAELIGGREYRVIYFRTIENDLTLGRIALVSGRENDFITIYLTGHYIPDKNYVHGNESLYELIELLVIK